MRKLELTEVVSIKFKSCGKNYYFSPEGLSVSAGDKVIVDTAKGLEMAECAKGNHMVEDESVVSPLRNVVRIATAEDLRAVEKNRQKEKEAFEICRRKIAEHGLDMKLVGVECNFEGSKTLFFFTSDGRVDFRELVKDLAGVFHNRIELRQIGVRDEAKMIGGIGICGRPYCCGQFLEEFAPVSTKMAKTQSLSLNPAKISGSCGRLMCCLRYEEEAYEDLMKKVPKQGAFVETIDGYGTAVSVNILRQKVKVSLDGETDDSLHEYSAQQVAAVPGGRPPEGEPYPKVLDYSAATEQEEIGKPEENDPWASPILFAETFSEEQEKNAKPDSNELPEDVSGEYENDRRQHRQRRGNNRKRHKSDVNRKPNPTPDTALNRSAEEGSTSEPQQADAQEEKRTGENGKQYRPHHNNNRNRRRPENKKQNAGSEPAQNQRPKDREEPAREKEAAQVVGESGQVVKKKKPYYGKRRNYKGNKKSSHGEQQKTE